MRKLGILLLAAVPLAGAYDFQDEDFSIYITLPGDWDCTTDLTRPGAGVFQFSGRGLEVVLKYAEDTTWHSSEEYLDHLLATAEDLMDSLIVNSRDTTTLWGVKASVADYRGFAQDGARVGRMFALARQGKTVAVIFVKLGEKGFDPRDAGAIRDFLRGVKVRIKPSQGER